VGYGAALALAACATASAPGRAPAPPAPSSTELALGFQLPAPQYGSLGGDLKLWATHYHTPVITPAPPEISSSVTLIGRNNRDISPRLRHPDWCKAALQGTVSIVEADGTVTAYAFLDSKGPEQANCDNQLGNLSDTIKLATRKARFIKVSHPYGCGVRSIPLMPFRTIATDPAVIPVGEIVYVPALRGKTFSLRGQSFTHDGYLFAGDRGGAIKGKHIDVFHGNVDDTPFEDIFASRESKTFEARVVKASDPAARMLTEAQGGHCDPVGRG
jgi:3D (Asp-Asp-Asp) domain-containing protein